MISRSDTPQQNSAPESPEDSLGEPEKAGQQEKTPQAGRSALGLSTAIALAGVGGALVGFAPLVGVVIPRIPAGFLSWPLMVMLAALPPGMAALFRRARKPGLAAAVLLGPAVLAPGRIVLDAQLAADAGLAARPELLLPHSLAPLSPGPGLWMLLAGHLVTGIAGAVAMNNGQRVPETSSGSVFGSSEAEDIAVSGARRQGLLALVLCATVLAAVGVLMAPFLSDNAFLLPRAALDSPPLVLVGSLLLSLGVSSAGGYVASSADPEFARGGLWGLAVALAGVCVPPLVATMVLPDLHAGWGTWLGVLASVALGVLALPAGRAFLREQSRDLLLPAPRRLLVAAGMLAMAGGALALLGTMTPLLVMPAGMGEQSPYHARMLWPAGIALALLGTGLLAPRLALRLRPALPVVAAVLPLTVAATLDTVLTAAQAAGGRAGLGAWAVGLALGLAVLAAVVAAVAGAVERDDVDLTELSMRPTVAWPALIALVLAIGGFTLPVLTAPGYTPPGVFTEFSMTSWGLVAALLAVVVAAALAPVSRPPRAAALLYGAALVLLVRVLELPLTAGRTPGASPGAGLWFALAAIVALLVAAALAARDAAPRRASGHGG